MRKSVMKNTLFVGIISPVRSAIQQQMEIRTTEVAAYYEDAIRHGMSVQQAREAFNTAMNAETDRYLPGIMADIPTYIIEIPKETANLLVFP